MIGFSCLDQVDVCFTFADSITKLSVSSEENNIKGKFFPITVFLKKFFFSIKI